MMIVELAYGTGQLPLEIPDTVEISIIQPRHIDGIPDPQTAIRDAVRSPYGTTPLQDLVETGDRVGVIFSDITRPTPNHVILPVVLDELEAAGVQATDIILFNALGTHRPNTAAELQSMLGPAISERYQIIQNDAFDCSSQVCMGTTSTGHKIWLNREMAGCDFVLLTGFIEPHFFAGFSGGGKAVMPGMAGIDSIMDNHSARLIGDPRAIWGIMYGNLLWEEVMEVARRLQRTFLLNVSLNKNRQVTGVFAGDLDEAHAAGCSFVKANAMVPVKQLFDIVITSNSGYPLDQNLYQAVKGMSAAAQIIKPGGTIIIASECRDGIPRHGLYGDLLVSANNPGDLLRKICADGFRKQDQWQAQIQAMIQTKANVFVYSDYLTAEQVEAAQLKPCHDINGVVKNLLDTYGLGSKICVLPEGPQTIPYLVIFGSI